MANAPKIPTKADLDALPGDVKGEIIEGVLYAMTRPRTSHQIVNGRAYSDIERLFDRGRGGPGGWWILIEPGIELPNTPEISPDIAGWRKDRLPDMPPHIAVVPDWVCEVLSPTTRRHNVVIKKPYYARIGVQHHWLVDLEARALTAHRLQAGQWLEVGVYSEETEARIEPFDAVPLDVASWWV